MKRFDGTPAEGSEPEQDPPKGRCKVFSKVELERRLRERDEAFGRLEEAHERLKGEYDDLLREAARNKADFVNYRNRVDRDRDRDRKLAAEGAVELLLPVLDNFGRTLQALEGDDSPLLRGIAMVERQFSGALESLGLVRIDAAGTFDPSLHEAVGVDPTSDPDRDGAIVQELQGGYLLGGKVIRPARVRVARYEEA